MQEKVLVPVAGL